MTADPGPPFPDEQAPPAAVTPIRRPLHRADELEWHPAATVVLFASPAQADAAQPLLPDTVCLGWSGIRTEIDLYDWAPLAKRQVLLWAGADRSQADGVNSLLNRLPDAVKLRHPEGWSHPKHDVSLDMTNAGWSAGEAQAWLALQLQSLEADYERLRRAELDRQADAEAEAAAGQEALVTANSETPHSPFFAAPFRILGYDEGKYFYLPNKTQQIVALQPREHVRANLAAIAPTPFWEERFPSKQGADWTAAAEALFRSAQDHGLFNASIIRGRGCWIDQPKRKDDQPRVVFHAGDQLIVNRQDYALGVFPSDHVYVRGQPLAPDQTDPLPGAEAAKFLKLCESLQWTSPIFGKLLAGWCMCAAVGGALTWRPHIWITGAAGTGKSWTIENVVNRFLGRFSLSILSSTTEAGMRQTIKSDAMPIVLDEAESEDEKSRARFKSILDLVRQSSSESGGSIIKGTIGGHAMEFRVRSCFCFASIGVAAVARADTSRITVLSLERRKDNALAFAAVKKLAVETVLDSAYTAGLRARALNYALEIRENAKVFAEAVAKKVQDARTGDQLGALIAGAFALTSTRRIELPEAIAWVDKQQWEAFVPTESDQDETRALGILAQSLIRVDTPKGPLTTSIGQLIVGYYDPATGPETRAAAANDLLLRGVKVMADCVAISCSHPELSRIYRDTIWAGKWKNQLERIGGPDSMIACCRFGAAANRAIKIPLAVFGVTKLELGL